MNLKHILAALACLLPASLLAQVPAANTIRIPQSNGSKFVNRDILPDAAGVLGWTGTTLGKIYTSSGGNGAADNGKLVLYSGFGGGITATTGITVKPLGGGVEASTLQAVGWQFFDGTNTLMVRPPTLTADRDLFFPDADGNLISTGDTGTVTNTMLAGSIDLATKVTGTLPVANGGTGITALGAGVAAWWGTPTIANLNSAVSDADLAILGANTFTGVQTLTPAARSGTSAAYFTLTTPADTALTAATESIGARFTAATRQFSTGAIATQRERVFAAPTYGFVGASTITTAVNVDIEEPVAGANATLTNKYALRAASARITGTLTQEGAIINPGSPILIGSCSYFQSQSGKFLYGTAAAPTGMFEAQGSGEHFRGRVDASNYFSLSNSATTGLTIDSVASGTPRIILNDHVVVEGPLAFKSYTVATLPSTAATGRVVGAKAVVTDALAPAYAATVVGGGAATISVMWDGSNWICN